MFKLIVEGKLLCIEQIDIDENKDIPLFKLLKINFFNYETVNVSVMLEEVVKVASCGMVDVSENIEFYSQFNDNLFNAVCGIRFSHGQSPFTCSRHRSRSERGR